MNMYIHIMYNLEICILFAILEICIFPSQITQNSSFWAMTVGLIPHLWHKAFFKLNFANNRNYPLCLSTIFGPNWQLSDHNHTFSTMTHRHSGSTKVHTFH